MSFFTTRYIHTDAKGPWSRTCRKLSIFPLPIEKRLLIEQDLGLARRVVFLFCKKCSDNVPKPQHIVMTMTTITLNKKLPMSLQALYKDSRIRTSQFFFFKLIKACMCQPSNIFSNYFSLSWQKIVNTATTWLASWWLQPCLLNVT